jgi:hypothetical protein
MTDRPHAAPEAVPAATHPVSVEPAPAPGAPTAPDAPPARSSGGPDRRAVAIVLIAIGVLGLLGNLGLAPALSTFIGFLLFAALGTVALMYAGRTGNDWVRAAAFPLFGLALATLWSGDWGGGAFLASLGAGFASRYLSGRDRWWAVIPAGVLFTLALVAVLGSRIWGVDTGVLFFLGLAATFAVLWRLPDHPQPWAIYPAAVCGVLAFIVLTTTGGWLVPVLLIAAGVYLVLRSRGDTTANRSGA